MFARETIKLSNITRLPSGRGMEAYCQGVCIVNKYIYIYIYAPSSSSNRQERENFTTWNSLAAFTAPTMIMGGVDFNCAVKNTDCTENTNFGKA